jgi:hypothetical protein
MPRESHHIPVIWMFRYSVLERGIQFAMGTAHHKHLAEKSSLSKVKGDGQW